MEHRQEPFVWFPISFQSEMRSPPADALLDDIAWISYLKCGFIYHTHEAILDDSGVSLCVAGKFKESKVIGVSCGTLCAGASSTLSLIGRCANCGLSQDGCRFSCGKCKFATYCSKECQVNHWKRGGHKQTCVQSPNSSSQKQSACMSCVACGQAPRSGQPLRSNDKGKQ